jgi:peptide-methionine (S)-S-oxide reductase
MRYNEEEKNITNVDTATFGGGCFWCVEAIFRQLKGVIAVTSGYSGGHVKNPSYREVCSGTTGHAEVCQITFNPQVISYDELLEIFFLVHDPTTLNRQGNDVGTQYRSVIFYHNQKQKSISLEYQKIIDESGAFEKPIVTEISSFAYFYKAENYHQEYYESNKMAPYCSCIITPKLEKFKTVFRDKLKAAVVFN